MIRNRLIPAIALAAMTSLAAGCGDNSGTGSDTSGGLTTPGDEPGTNPGKNPGTKPGKTPGTGPGEEPGTGPGEEPGTGPGEEPGTGPGEEPGTGPGEEPGTGTEAGVDTFGVQMIYPSKAGGEAWFLADDADNDPRFDPQDEITQNSDGSWKMRESQVRMHALTSDGYDESSNERDHGVLAERGYMATPNDWKNVEMTGYIKVNETDDESDNFAWYARGGRHTDSIACEGVAYKGSLHYDGQVRFQKESWHVSYEASSYASPTDSIIGRWVGFKSIVRDVEIDGKTAVQLELWLDDDADQTFEKVYEMVDAGDWGGDHATCGGTDGMPITWGGPMATFRWDSTTDVDFKWLSVREIDPIQ